MNENEDINFVLVRWEVNKTIQNNYPEKYSNIISQQKNIIYSVLYKNIETDLLVYKISDNFIDMFDSYNIEVEEEIVNVFCKLVVELERNKEDAKKIIERYK